jgi:hypothetical protein
MRPLAVTPTLMLCLALLGCVNEKRNPVEGSWRIVSGRQKTADTAFSYFGRAFGARSSWWNI